MKKAPTSFVMRTSLWMALSFIVALPSFSAAYMSVTGLVGEAIDKDHTGWADIISFSYDITGPTGLARTPSFNDITIVKELDSMSNGLAQAAARGQVFPEVVLHLTASYTDAGRVTYYEIILRNVRVSSYAISGSGQSEEVPTEQVTLAFEEATVRYHQIGNDGVRGRSVEYTWNAQEGK